MDVSYNLVLLMLLAFTYLDSVTSEACSSNCHSCDSAGAGRCDEGQCHTGYTLRSDGLCGRCHVGCSLCDTSGIGKCDRGHCSEGYTYRTDGSCKQCHQYCLRCDTAGPGRCDQQRCKVGYVHRHDNTCARCDVNCGVCTNAGAGHCDPGHCKSGYTLQADATCASCAAHCENCTTSGPARCDNGQCVPGFSSTAAGICGLPSIYLLYAGPTYVRRISLDTNNYHKAAQLPLNSPSINVVALDVHIAAGKFYYSDVQAKVIRRANLDGSAVEIIIGHNVDVVDGLAIDWVAENLYWTDTGRNVIEVSRLNGTSRHLLVSTLLDEPRAIKVYPIKGLLFWTDWGIVPRIERSYLDGSRRTVIVVTNLGWPNGLTIDYEANRLYWVDGKMDRLEAVNFDGRDRVLLSTSVMHPFGITLFGEHLYLTDWQTASVDRFDKRTGRNKVTVQNQQYKPMGITVVYSDKQPGSGACGVNNGGCSHLCLARGPTQVTCACPSYMRIGDTCQQAGTCAAGKVNDLNDKSQCVACPLDTYQPISSSADAKCLNCPLGTGTLHTRSTRQSDCKTICAAGHMPVSGKCEPCPVGFYKQAGNRFGNCEQCPQNMVTSSTASTSSADCHSGTCAAGEVNDLNDKSQCVACPLDTYQPISSSADAKCLNCPLGTGTLHTRSTRQSDCKKICAAGHMPVSGKCEPCPIGFYKQAGNRFGNCEQCPQNMVTSSTASTSSADCHSVSSVGVSIATCAAGEMNDRIDQSRCVACPLDTYKPKNSSAKCQNCPPGTGTLYKGSTERTNCKMVCKAGHMPRGASCVPCAKDFYKEAVDRFGACVRCGSGKTTTGVGSTTASQCKAAPTKRKLNIGYIIGGAVLLIVIVIVIIIAVVVVKRCRQPRPRKRESEIQENFGYMKPMPNVDGTLRSESGAVSGHHYEELRLPLNNHMTGKIPVQDLTPHILRNHGDNFGFEKLPAMCPDIDDTNNCKAIKKHGGKKNASVITDYEKQKAQYIEARFVNGYKKSKAYLTCDAPMKANVNDLWRLIWQSNTTHILMLTHLVEDGQENCYQYWPHSVGDTEVFGKISVTLMDEQIYADFTIRVLTAKYEGKTRQLDHFQYTTWPHNAIPLTTTTLISLRNLLTRHHGDNPLLVHSSHGMGRAGTYVALDCLLHMGLQEGQVDIAGCVSRLRMEMRMTQTAEQYAFLHRALLEGLEASSRTYPCAKFSAIYENLLQVANSNILTSQYAELEKRNRILMKTSKISKGLSGSSRSKNRLSTIIPFDDHRPRLITRNLYQSDYINAAYVNGYHAHDEFIVTQLPFADTRDDFWRMILEHNVPLLVTVDEPQTETEKFLPTKNHSCKVYGSVRVTFVSETAYRQFVNLTVYHVVSADNPNGIALKQLTVTDWPASQTQLPTTDAIIHLVDCINGFVRESGKGPIVIQCCDGATRCGVVCALCYCMMKMQVEKTVDVFSCVHAVRQYRPQLIRDMAQYHYLYLAAHDILMRS